MATQKEVAEHLFFDPRWARELIKKGILISNNAKGGLDIDDCRKRYIEYLRAVKAGQIKESNEEEPEEVRAARLKEKGLETKLRKENYQLSVLEKKYAPIEIITTTLQRVAQSLSIRNESFSARVKQCWPNMPPEAKEEIDRLVAEGANELADMRPDLSDFRESNHASGDQWLEAIEDGAT